MASVISETLALQLGQSRSEADFQSQQRRQVLLLQPLPQCEPKETKDPGINWINETKTKVIQMDMRQNAWPAVDIDLAV